MLFLPTPKTAREVQKLSSKHLRLTPPWRGGEGGAPLASFRLSALAPSCARGSARLAGVPPAVAAASLRVGKTCKGVGKSWCLHDRSRRSPTACEACGRVSYEHHFEPPPPTSRGTKSQHQDRTHARTDTQRQTHQAQDTADTPTADTHTSESQPRPKHTGVPPSRSEVWPVRPGGGYVDPPPARRSAAGRRRPPPRSAHLKSYSP